MTTLREPLLVRLPYNRSTDPLLLQIRSEILAQNRSIIRFCTAAGVGRQTLRLWLRGKTSPQLDTLRAVCDELGLEITLTRKGQGQ